VRNFIFISSILIFVSGCTTVEFVRKDTSPHKQGLLRYLPSSSSSKMEKYHNKAIKMASDFCGGKFKITKEYEALEQATTSTGVGSGIGFGSGGILVGTSAPSETMYKFIEFSCEE
jgi:hypothetical protein